MCILLYYWANKMMMMIAINGASGLLSTEVEEGQEFFGPQFKSSLFGLLRLVET